MSSGDRDRDRADEQPRRTRLEDEVREILVRADHPTSLRDHVQRRTARRPPMRAKQRAAWTPAALGGGLSWIASMAFALLGVMVQSSSPLLGGLFGIASAVALAMLWLRRGGASAGPAPKRWRGRDLDFGPGSSAWLDGMRDRFRRPPRS